MIDNDNDNDSYNDDAGHVVVLDVVRCGHCLTAYAWYACCADGRCQRTRR